jgi:hypothetical protein
MQQPREQAGVLGFVICKLLHVFSWLKRHDFDRVGLAWRRRGAWGGTWAVGYFFWRVFKGLIFPRPKQKWQKMVYRKKVTGLSLATAFRSDRVMVFGTPMSKNKKQNSARR